MERRKSINERQNQPFIKWPETSHVSGKTTNPGNIFSFSHLLLGATGSAQRYPQHQLGLPVAHLEAGLRVARHIHSPVKRRSKEEGDYHVGGCTVHLHCGWRSEVNGWEAKESKSGGYSLVWEEDRIYCGWRVGFTQQLQYSKSYPVSLAVNVGRAE